MCFIYFFYSRKRGIHWFPAAPFQITVNEKLHADWDWDDEGRRCSAALFLGIWFQLSACCEKDQASSFHLNSANQLLVVRYSCYRRITLYSIQCDLSIADALWAINRLKSVFWLSLPFFFPVCPKTIAFPVLAVHPWS